MICLRCGYCCKNIAFVVVTDPSNEPSSDNAHYTNGTCKHLRGSAPGKFLCTVHDKPWFKDSCCGRFGGQGNAACSVGETTIRQYKDLMETGVKVKTMTQ